MIFRHPPGAGHLPRGKTCQSFPPGRLARWHAAGRTLSDRGEHLEDFYACLYYAALRPLEALKLRESDLHLPKKGWGMTRAERAGCKPLLLHLQNGPFCPGRLRSAERSRGAQNGGSRARPGEIAGRADHGLHTPGLPLAREAHSVSPHS
jgi:hypothetical protein